ncbi:MAG: tyrosine-type recombinase/integrase [Candidatus Eiseniibacteriota bacterium]
MAKRAFTAIGVKNAKPGNKRREIADHTPGLHLVVQPSGAKSWALRFRGKDGRPVKLTLGPADVTGRDNPQEPAFGDALTLGQARRLAIRVNDERATGTDVVAHYRAEARKRAAVAAAMKRGSVGAVADVTTFAGAAAEFFTFYRTKHGIRPRRWRDDARLLGLRWKSGDDPEKVAPEVVRGGIADLWAAKPVDEVRKADVIAMVDRAMRHGIPGLAKANEGVSGPRGRKVHAALSAVFRWLEKRDRVPLNPCRGAWHPPPPPSRTRFLDDAEIATFWRACDALRQPYCALFRFLLLSGLRRDEASKIRYDELENGILTVPSSRTKNHVELQLPLPQLALDILAGVPRVEGHALVFGINRDKAPQDFSRVRLMLDAEMARLAGREIKPFTIHDLRRSAASGMQRIGIRFEAIEAVLNHVIAGVAGTYQRDTLLAAKRDALRRWSDHVAGVVAGRADNVVAIRP